MSNKKRGATRRKKNNLSEHLTDQQAIATPQQTSAETQTEQSHKKPSLVLIIVTIIALSLLVILLTQLKPSVPEISKPTSESEQKKQTKDLVKSKDDSKNIAEELTKVKPKYDFYEILPQGYDKFTQNELTRLDQARAQAALQAEIPVPLNLIAPKQNINQTANEIIQKPKLKDQPKKESPKTQVITKNLDIAVNKLNQNSEYQTLEPIKKKPKKEVTTANSANSVNHIYFWQVGASFKAKNEAENLRLKLSIAGHIAQIETSKIKGEIWHKVLVGPFSDKAKMIVIQQQLTTQGFNNLLLQQRVAK